MQFNLRTRVDMDLLFKKALTFQSFAFLKGNKKAKGNLYKGRIFLKIHFLYALI